MESVAIVGVGLIGGSFGLALKQAGFSGPIFGVSSAGAIQEGLARGAINEALPLAEAAARADLIYLSQPIGRILDTLRRLEEWVRPGVLVTDAGSTKRVIVSTAARRLFKAQFIGGHPMAGKEKGGTAEAEADLFRGRTYVLAPRHPSELETPAAGWLMDWIGRIGSRLLVLDPDEHDRLVAFTSHLAQLASTALACTVAENLESAEELAAAGPGLLDTTRLALSPYDIWRDIFETNADSIEYALSAFIQRLENYREALRDRQMRDEFHAAAQLALELRKDTVR
jgi:prephenate dehydrogenase